jgi:F0F1-type ATP synthase membrane subunit b/b'
MTQSHDFYVQAAAWSQVIASLLFVAVLLWLWFRYIQPAILASQANSNRQIAEAERHRDEAKAALELLKTATHGASHDAELIKERAVAQAARESEAAIAEARGAGERALRNAQGEFSRALTSARAQLRDELAGKALDRARSEAMRRVDAGLDARLVDGFIGSLERGNG